MREVMVGRARVAVLRTAAKSAVLREKSRAEFTHCKIFQERDNIGLIEARACLCREELPSYVSRGAAASRSRGGGVAGCFGQSPAAISGKICAKEQQKRGTSTLVRKARGHAPGRPKTTGRGYNSMTGCVAALALANYHRHAGRQHAALKNRSKLCMRRGASTKASACGCAEPRDEWPRS
jgi:hypothetical protein